MRTAPGAAVAVLAAFALLAQPAAGFRLMWADDPDAGRAAFEALRWDVGQPGLAGGLEWSMDASFCRTIAAESPGLECAEVNATVRQAFRDWEAVNPNIRFTDVSWRVAPVEDWDRPNGTPPQGAEIDLFALSKEDDWRGHVFEAATVNSRAEDGKTLTNGTRSPGKVFQAVDLYVWTEPLDCTDDGCWNPRLLRSILLHEIGHALGLDHPFEGGRMKVASPGCTPQGLAFTQEDAPSVMNYRWKGLHSERVTPDDAAALAVLYPVCERAAPARDAPLAGLGPGFWVAVGGGGFLAVVIATLATLLVLDVRRSRADARQARPPR